VLRTNIIKALKGPRMLVDRLRTLDDGLEMLMDEPACPTFP
jgi:hypothetical protein